MRSIFSLLFLLTGVMVYAQQDSTSAEPPREKEIDSLGAKKFIPTGIRIGTDVISLVKSNLSNQFNGWEVNADIDLSRYYLVMDYGHWATTTPIKDGEYSNDGKYMRFGVDINFLKKDVDRNMFFLGFRIGRSSFSDQATFIDSVAYSSTATSNFGVTTKTLENNHLIGHWAELTTGLRVKIYKFFWMGYTARMKFSPSVTGQDELVSYDIPGFGLASRKLYWGFNYQLFFKIPFTNKERKGGG